MKYSLYQIISRLVIIIFAVLNVSCKGNLKVETGALSMERLELFFETKEIEYFYQGKNIILKINNSNFVKNEEAKRIEEPATRLYFSLAAMMLFDEVKKRDKEFENIIINIDGVQISHSNLELVNVFKYINIQNLFISNLKQGKIEVAKSYLVDKFQSEFESFTQSLNKNGKLDRSEIIGYKIIEDSKVLLFANLKFDNGTSGTVMFIFQPKDKGNKIAGIQSV